MVKWMLAYAADGHALGEDPDNSPRQKNGGYEGLAVDGSSGGG